MKTKYDPEPCERCGVMVMDTAKSLDYGCGECDHAVYVLCSDECYEAEATEHGDEYCTPYADMRSDYASYGGLFG